MKLNVVEIGDDLLLVTFAHTLRVMLARNDVIEKSLGNDCGKGKHWESYR